VANRQLRTDLLHTSHLLPKDGQRPLRRLPPPGPDAVRPPPQLLQQRGWVLDFGRRKFTVLVAGVNPPHFCSVPPPPKADIQAVVEANPILAALVLSSSLHLHPKIPGHNHNDHLPLNPYLALLLSHYGKYSPVFGKGRGLYGYVAANNYHNNKPFGAYKIYEDGDGWGWSLSHLNDNVIIMKMIMMMIIIIVVLLIYNLIKYKK
jgi:hypothetical protein